MCRLQSIATHRDHFVRRLSVRPSVCLSVRLSHSQSYVNVKKFADSKEFTKCNSRIFILLHLPSAIGKFLKIAQVKTRWTFIHSVNISLRSSVVARSLSKPEVPGSNPTVGKNLTFCNSRSTRDPHSSSKTMRMKSTMTYTYLANTLFQKRFARIKYGCRLQWFITFHVSFKFVIRPLDVLSVLLFVRLKSERYGMFCIKLRNTATNFVVKNVNTRLIKFAFLSDAIHITREHRQNAIQCLNIWHIRTFNKRIELFNVWFFKRWKC